MPWAQRIPYKFIVDGQWSVKENRPTEYDSVGNLNNVYHSPPRPTPIQLKSAASSIMTETTIDAGEHQIVQVEEEDVIVESPGEKEDGKKIDDGNDQHNMPERDSEVCNISVNLYLSLFLHTLLGFVKGEQRGGGVICLLESDCNGTCQQHCGGMSASCVGPDLFELVKAVDP